MQKKQIQENDININILKTGKFSTSIIKYMFEVKKEHAKGLFLLRHILPRGTKKLKTTSEICRELGKNYSQSINVGLSRKKRRIFFEIQTTILNPKYTDKDTFFNSLNIFNDFLYDPLLIDNNFKNEYIEYAKKQVIADIESIVDNSRAYANMRATEESDEIGEYSDRPFKTVEEVLAVNKEDITAAYNYLINNTYKEIFVIGDIDESILLNGVKRLKQGTEKLEELGEYTDVKRELKVIEEDSKFNQSNLIMIYKGDYKKSKTSTPIFNTFSDILGEGTDSLLFENVREKNSLCYSVGSSSIDTYKFLYISAGINFCNYDLAKNLIIEQVENIKIGNFDNEKLENSIKNTIDELGLYEDSIYMLLNDYIKEVLFNREPIEKRIEIYKNIKKEDIIEFAKQFELNTVYLLKGGLNEEL